MKKVIITIMAMVMLTVGGNDVFAQTFPTKTVKMKQTVQLPSIQMEVTKDQTNLYYIFSSRQPNTKFDLVFWLNGKPHLTTSVKTDSNGFVFIKVERKYVPKGHYDLYALIGNVQMNNTEFTN